MKKRLFILTSMIIVLILSACTTSGEAETAVSTTDTTNGKTRLAADYTDALTVQSQLALGTLQLEETELAVEETVAAEILPLWQALQSLNNSETAAAIEIEAVINQIQDAMDPAQIQAIAAMKLTNEGLTAMAESGELNLGRGTGQNRDGTETTSGGGGMRGSSLPGGPGSGPGGGIPGTGGGPGGGFANLSEDDLATRQAEFENSGGFAAIQDQALLGSVVRLLQTKTGEAPVGGPGAFFGTALDVVSTETGIPVADIQAQMNEGQTLVQIIEAAGGDVEAIRTALLDALSGMSEDPSFTPEEFINNLLQQ